MTVGCQTAETILYEETFENGDGGYVADNSGGATTGLWHYSVGRRADGLSNHTPVYSWYYGAWETATGGGQYPTYPNNQGTLTSPLIPEVIPLEGMTTLTFSYLLGTRSQLDRDIVEVSVLYTDEFGVAQADRVLARSDGTLPQTGNSWQTAEVDLSGYGGRQIRLEFFFNTGDAPVVDPEGWYVDDIVIRSTFAAADFGDAPGAGYATLAVDNGACHAITDGLHLGSEIDSEADGQPTPDADGDDSNLVGQPDDEDGVAFLTLLVAGELAEIDVLASAPGRLDAWMDFGSDGSWAEPGDQIFASMELVAGANELDFAIPADAALGTTYARFRFSDAGGLSFDGAADDGEVEDYRVEIREVGMDFGDAPNEHYPTLLIDDGARHEISGGLYLGTGVDWEISGQPDASSVGDDQDSVYPSTGDIPFPMGDEDGVTFTTPIIRGRQAEIEVVASAAGLLDAWVDFGDDGSWDEAGDQIFASQALAAGTNLLTFTVPDTTLASSLQTRFRFSSDGGLSVRGAAPDGEVEDHIADACNLQWQNPVNRFDVNNDGFVNLADVLSVLDEIEFGTGARPLPNPTAPPPPPPYWDVDGDCAIRIEDAREIYLMLDLGVEIRKATNAADPYNPTTEEDADQPVPPGEEIVLAVGETVTWTYLVRPVTRQGGDVLNGLFPLRNVVVLDDQLGPVDYVEGDVNGNDWLDPGETWLYRAAGEVVDGPYVNTGTATADRADTDGQLIEIGGTTTVSDSDTSGYLGAAPLRLSHAVTESPAAPSSLSEDVLQAAKEAVIELFVDAGLDDSRACILAAVAVRTVDLPDEVLGLALNETILIDADAAGQGWIVELPEMDKPLPAFGPEQSDAVARSGQGANLLAVLAHEMGHVLGLGDLQDEQFQRDLMFAYLGTDRNELALEVLIDRLGFED